MSLVLETVVKASCLTSFHEVSLSQEIFILVLIGCGVCGFVARAVLQVLKARDSYLKSLREVACMFRGFLF